MLIQNIYACVIYTIVYGIKVQWKSIDIIIVSVGNQFITCIFNFNTTRLNLLAGQFTTLFSHPFFDGFVDGGGLCVYVARTFPLLL